MSKNSMIYASVSVLILGISFGWFLRGATVEKPVKEVDLLERPVYSAPTQNVETDSRQDFSEPRNVAVGDDVHDSVTETKVPSRVVTEGQPVSDNNNAEVIVANKEVTAFAQFTAYLAKEEYAEAGNLYLVNRLNLSAEDKPLWLNLWVSKAKQSKVMGQSLLDAVNGLLNVESGHYELILLKVQLLKINMPVDEVADILQGEASYITDLEAETKLFELIQSLRQENVKILMQSQRYNELQLYLKECILKEPSNYVYYFQLGSLLKSLRSEQEATYYLEMIPFNSPYHEEAAKIIEAIQADVSKDQKGYLAAGQEIRLPIETDGKNYYIVVKINDIYDVKLLIDTGASIGMISETVAREVSGHVGDWKSFSLFKTAGGLVKKPLLLIERIQVGPVIAKRLIFSIDDNEHVGVPGLLGMNFLGHFNFEINTAEKVLILKSKN